MLKFKKIIIFKILITLQNKEKDNKNKKKKMKENSKDIIIIMFNVDLVYLQDL